MSIPVVYTHRKRANCGRPRIYVLPMNEFTPLYPDPPRFVGCSHISSIHDIGTPLGIVI
jgi:hypothetical protein